MCTFIGHTMLGTIVGLNRNGLLGQRWWIMILWIFIFANLPDVDLLFGYLIGRPTVYHHLWTHSLFFTILVGILFGLGYGLIKKRNGLRPGILVSVVSLSHVGADFFAMDKGDPRGVQLFWPISTKFYISEWSIFQDVHKGSTNQTFFQDLLCTHNLYTILREVVILGPILILVIITHYWILKKKFSHES